MASTDSEDTSALGRLLREAGIEDLLPDSAERAEFVHSDLAKPLAAWAGLHGAIASLRAAILTADATVEATRDQPLLAPLLEAAEHIASRLEDELADREGEARALVRDVRDCCGLWTVVREHKRKSESASAGVVPETRLSTPPATPSGKRTREAPRPRKRRVTRSRQGLYKKPALRQWETRKPERARSEEGKANSV